MPFNSADTSVYREDVQTRGSTMSTEERRQLLERYLPNPNSMRQRKAPSTSSPSRRQQRRRKRLRPWLKQKMHWLLYIAIQLVFGVYRRLRQILSAVLQKFIGIRHYHHRTPAYIQKDLKGLSRLPKHLSVLLKYDASNDDGLETLLDEVAELSAWSTAAGIPLLSVYERTGVLKQYMSALHEMVQQKLILYFGTGSSAPTLRVCAPNYPSLSPVPSPRILAQDQMSDHSRSEPSSHLNLLLLSESDGRDTLVDLTRTLAEMAQAHKLRPEDITVELVDAEINATTAVPSSETSRGINGTSSTSNGIKRNKDKISSEPDLLIVFAPVIRLDGYPPWQIRLTEIFCVGDSGGDVSGRMRTRVEYQSFLRALWKYAGAEFRFGS